MQCRFGGRPIAQNERPAESAQHCVEFHKLKSA